MSTESIIKYDGWKFGGQATGSTPISLDNKPNEVLIRVHFYYSTATYEVLWQNTFKPYSTNLGTNGGVLFIGGYYAGSGDYGVCNVNVSKDYLKYSLRNVKFASGTSYLSSSTLEIWYK